MTTKIEQRTISASLRALPSSFELAGVAVAYDVLSSDLGGFRERIARGAFTRALNEKQNVVCLFNHDQNFVLGRTTSGTLSLQDGDGRLAISLPSEPRQPAASGPARLHQTRRYFRMFVRLRGGRTRR